MDDGPVYLAQLAASHGVRDERLLEAIRTTPREEFVPKRHRGEAYLDRPVPLPHGQTTSQPTLIAMMVEALELEPEARVLEIGTGYGYQTALLAKLAAEVWSVEWYADLADAARENLLRHGLENVHVRAGDGTEGVPEAAPFDGIVISAAGARVPRPLADQLADGGRLVMPVGSGGLEEVVVFERDGGQLRELRVLTGARFVPLSGRHVAD